MSISLNKNSFILLVTIIFAVSMTCPQAATAFERGPKKKVHEALTKMAVNCLIKNTSNNGSLSCLASPVAFMDKNLLKKHEKMPGVYFKENELRQVTIEEIIEGVKWPDDPTNEVGFWTIYKFGTKLLRKCEKKFDGGLKDGLLCSSHYGPLQFWHAMAIRDETTEQTRHKMLSWARFLYDVATDNELRENTNLLDTDYCSYWNRQPDYSVDGGLRKILAPNKEFPCNEDGPDWKVRTIFSMTCRNPFNSKYCLDNPDHRATRINAVGAILHMVQDSFAQGHTDRGMVETKPKTNRIQAKFECRPINQFYTYVDQSKEKHGQADAVPKPGDSCSDPLNKIDDPITASAKVLWYIQEKRGQTELINYLENKVFALAEDHKSKTGPGISFAKK